MVVTYTYKCTSTHAQTWSFLSWNISICSTSVVCSPPSPPFSRINDSLCAFRITDRALSGPRTANGGLHAGVSGAVTGGITCVRRCSGTRVCMHVSEYILQEKSQCVEDVQPCVQQAHTRAYAAENIYTRVLYRKHRLRCRDRYHHPHSELPSHVPPHPHLTGTANVPPRQRSPQM